MSINDNLAGVNLEETQVMDGPYELTVARAGTITQISVGFGRYRTPTVHLSPPLETEPDDKIFITRDGSRLEHWRGGRQLRLEQFCGDLT